MSRIPKKFLLLLALGIFILLYAMVALENINRATYVQKQRLSVMERLGAIRARIEGAVNSHLSVVRGLTVTIATHPDINQSQFSLVSREYMRNNPHILNMAAAPDLQIRLLYPIMGNEKVLGMDLKTVQNESASLAVRTGEIVFAGPVDLIQGGRAFLARAPVFIAKPYREKQPGDLWGIVSVPISVDGIFRDAGLFSREFGLQVVMEDLMRADHDSQVIFGDDAIFDSNPMILYVDIPGGRWKMGAIPADGWDNQAPDSLAIRTFFSLVIIMMILFTAYRIHQRQKLQIAEEELQNRQEMMKQAQRAVGIGTWAYDIERMSVVWSEETMNLLGAAKWDNPSPDVMRKHIHPDDLELFNASLSRAVEGEAPHNISYRVKYDDGTLHWIHSEASLIRNERGLPRRLVGIVQDVTEKKHSEDSLRKLSEVVNQSRNSIVITNLEGEIEYVNPAFENQTGYSVEEALGKKPSILKSGHHPAKYYEDFWDTIVNGNTWRGEFRNKRKDGSLYWDYSTVSPIRDELGKITHYLAVKEDVSLRKEQEEQLHYQAHYDRLTGLPNRYSISKVLMAEIENAIREKHGFALFFIDMDRFNHVNDILGHDFGDHILVLAARRIEESLNEGDILARFGGDEFMCIVRDDTLENLTLVANRLIASFEVPFFHKDRELIVTVSVGISRCPTDGASNRELLRNADVAMHRAKEGGRNTYRFFKAEMKERTRRWLEVESHLRRALDRGEFSMAFQPIIRLSDNSVAGAEALLRWNSETLGMIPPDQFIPIAEETGLIVGIGKWVIQTAVSECARWRQETNDHLRVAINVSPRQFSGGRILDQFEESLDRHDMNWSAIEVEVTEGLLIKNFKESRVILEDLRGRGCHLSIDDFGTGYSSLSYLKQFPFHTLKVDRGFVTDIEYESDDANLVSAIISLSHRLGLQVIAEGIENETQMNMLKGLGCDKGQGYYFHRPMTSDQFIQFVKSSKEDRI